MADLKLKAGSSVTLQATGSSTVANGAWGTAATSEVLNDSVLAPEWSFELQAGFSVAPAAGVAIILVLVPKLDGTNLGDIDETNDRYQLDHIARAFVTASAGTASRRLTIQGVRLGPFKYTAKIFNQAGQTVAANWILTGFPSSGQSTS